MSLSHLTVGLDVGDKRTHFCVVAADRTVVARGSFATTRGALEQGLAPFSGARIVLEAGSQSPWMSRVLRGLGHPVQVADPRRVELISKDPRKTDRRDAELLARMGAAMPELLGSVHHRGEQAQAHISIVRARDLLVRQRTMAVQQTRSICKAFGVRLPSASTDGFPAKVETLIPDLLRPALDPVLVNVTHLSSSIKAFDKLLAQLAAKDYPEVQRLQQIDGIGPVISVAFVLSVEDPKRFASSRQVGSWLGLCPRSHSSGDSSPQLRISKAGDSRMRRLLTQGAQRILGPFGKDCDLRRFGLQIAARGGKSAKKRAIVAVARKLAVLMHKLWLTGRDYEPLHLANRRAKAALPASV
ncbi:MAG: IS110 family transposase [Planctomycetota bacterium]